MSDFNPEPKARLKSKTNWFGIGLVFFGGLQTFLPQLQAMIPEQYHPLITMAIGMTVILLREFTKEPVR